MSAAPYCNLCKCRHGSEKAAEHLANLRRVPRGPTPNLLPRADWQTPVRGTNEAEYEIYVENAKALGWKIKTYEEWMAS